MGNLKTFTKYLAPCISTIKAEEDGGRGIHLGGFEKQRIVYEKRLFKSVSLQAFEVDFLLGVLRVFGIKTRQECFYLYLSKSQSS